MAKTDVGSQKRNEEEKKKNNQTETLELKRIISDLEKSLDGLKNRLE